MSSSITLPSTLLSEVEQVPEREGRTVGELLQEAVHVAADPEDDRILERALAASADVIISGDSHLLELKSFRGIPIMSPRQFLDLGPWKA